METIERMDPFKHKEQLMYPEHFARYMFAASFITNKKVIDCSSGNGYGSYYLAMHGAAQVTGVDIAEEAVNFAERHYAADNLQFVQSDATKLSDIFSKEHDVYVCFETIEHLERPQELIAEAKKLLLDGGVFIVSCPNDSVFNPDNPYHKATYSLEKFIDLLRDSFQHVKLYVQNNTAGTTIFDPESIETADEQSFPVISHSYPITKKDRNMADTWLAVCSDEPLPEEVRPVSTFFTSYSQYIIEIQETIHSLYEENKRLAAGWEKQRATIHDLDREKEVIVADLNRLSEGWEKQRDFIHELEHQGKLREHKMLELQSELDKFTNAWNEHDAYIKKIEVQNEELRQHILNLESQFKQRE